MDYCNKTKQKQKKYKTNTNRNKNANQNRKKIQTIVAHKSKQKKYLKMCNNLQIADDIQPY